MIDPKEAFQQGANLSPKDMKALERAGIAGTVKIGNFSADFLSLEGESFHVNLTSAAVWLGVVTEEQDYVLFVEQADRTLPDGSHPWEVPSGRVDPQKDTNIYSTLIREVREETGIPLTNALPIAVAIKREQDGMPDITIVPTADDEIWIHSEEKMRELAKEGELEGGLICISRISLETLFKLQAEIVNIEPDGTHFCNLPHVPITIIKTPFGDIGHMRQSNRIDPSEISKAALEPLDNIIDGKNQFISQTSHMWAQADAFRTFMLKIHSGQ